MTYLSPVTKPSSSLHVCCRFTPADLMVVVKTLTYRQFSFLLSMASARTGSVGSSSDVGSTGSQTPLSSEMSEVRLGVMARLYTF